MPETGGGVGKSEEFYAIARQISNRDWKRFARGESYLNIPQNIIDDIEYDYPRSIQEQKYQMILKWEQRLGRNATVDSLKEKANHFLGRCTVQPNPDSSASSMELGVNQAQFINFNRESEKFRRLLMKISIKLNNTDLRRLKVFYHIQEDFDSPCNFLFHLENNNLWPISNDSSISGKLDHLKGTLASIERNDVVQIIEDSQRTFTDDDRSINVQIPSNAVQQNPNRLNDQNNQRQTNDAQADYSEQHHFQSFASSTVTASSAHFEGCEVSNFSGIDNELDSNQKHTETGASPFMDDQLLQETTCNTILPLQVGADDDLNDICTYNGTNVFVKPCTKEFYEEKMSPSHAEEVYKVSTFKGCALIISNVSFPSLGDNCYRYGGDNDCLLMENLFGRNGLGLNTIVKHNLTADNMKDVIEAFSQRPEHANADMCVVLIMSHGDFVKGKGDAIYGTDCQYVFAQDILRLFDNDKCPHLKLKPKMFFFQFCRGRTADRGVRSDKAEFVSCSDDQLSEIEKSLKKLAVGDDAVDQPGKHLPRRSDMLVAYSTQEGDSSFRSWFTNALANVFSKKAHNRHVCDMLKEVKRGLLNKVSQSSNLDHHECKEMADVRDILLKNVYFFPGFP